MADIEAEGDIVDSDNYRSVSPIQHNWKCMCNLQSAFKASVPIDSTNRHSRLGESMKSNIQWDKIANKPVA